MKALGGFAVAVLLVLGGTGAAPSAVAAPTQTYYWLVFNDPVAGQEAQYDTWYDTQHLPAILAVPGIVDAQRFVLSDKQLRTLSAPKPHHLVVYHIVTDNLRHVFDEINHRMALGRIPMSSALDQRSLQSYTYRVFKPVIAGAGGQPPGVRADAPLQYFDQLVFADPAEGQDVEFNHWYDTQHAREVSSVPGFVTAQRMVLSELQMQPTMSSTRYLTLYQIATPDIGAVIDEFGRRVGAMNMSRAYDDHRAFGYTYRAAGALRHGQRVRAWRSKD